MSRQFDFDEEPDGPEPPGHIGTTTWGSLIGFALVGVVLGWLTRPVSIRVSGSAPTVGWLPVLALFLAAAVLGSVAWATYRALHRRGERIEPHRAVNRLVLAKASALAGALFAGGYFGYALSYLGIAEAALARERVLHSLLAGAASVLIVAASLLLERACRVRHDDDRDLR